MSLSERPRAVQLNRFRRPGESPADPASRTPPSNDCCAPAGSASSSPPTRRRRHRWGSGRYRWRSGVLDVGASRRLVSDKQFRALMIRDHGCCTVPGCRSSIGLEAHHVQFWMWGGKTITANLILLCRAHHHAVHDGAFTSSDWAEAASGSCDPTGPSWSSTATPQLSASTGPVGRRTRPRTRQRRHHPVGRHPARPPFRRRRPRSTTHQHHAQRPDREQLGGCSH